MSRISRFRVLDGVVLAGHHQVARLTVETRDILWDAARRLGFGALTKRQFATRFTKLFDTWIRSKAGACVTGCSRREVGCVLFSRDVYSPLIGPNAPTLPTWWQEFR